MTKNSLRDELLHKVPSKLKEEPHLQALLDHIKHHNINTKEHLADFLQKEIALIEKWLDDNKKAGSLGVKSVRDKVIHLDVLRKCFKLSQEFLF
ncbi:hypothetical protein HYT52_03635 [Candidatus Woesearchaeota archaeon]|nr:hypothetical protein [Candidatus Woesearchaeota archaeon]